MVTIVTVKKGNYRGNKTTVEDSWTNFKHKGDWDVIKIATSTVPESMSRTRNSSNGLCQPTIFGSTPNTKEELCIAYRDSRDLVMYTNDLNQDVYSTGINKILIY